MANVTEKFFLPLRGSFLVPQGFDPAAFGRDLAEFLGGYSDHQLEEGVRWIKQNRTMRTFPTIAECRQACERFAFAPAQARTVSVEHSSEWMKSDSIQQDQRRQEAEAMCQDLPLSKVAHAEGWLQTLLEFAEDKRRLPSDHEVQKIKRKVAAVDANLHSHPRPCMYEVLCGWRQNMKNRAAERLWGSPVEVAEDRKSALKKRLAAFQREYAV